MALQNNKDRVIFDRIRPEPDPEHGSPICRSSHGLSALVDARGKFHRLIVYGGENVARTPITDAAQVLWLAQKDSNAQNEGGSGSGGWRWVSLSPNDNDRPTPPSRVAHSQAAVGHAVYIFGGRGGVDIGETALNDLWKLDIVGGCTEESGPPHAKWTQIVSSGGDDVPEARSFHKMISTSSNLYVFGGCGSKGRLNDLWKFDTITGKWESLGSSHILRGRGGPNIFALAANKEDEVRLAVVAGFAGEETNDGHIFNNAWETNAMEGLSNLRPRSVCAFGSLPIQKRCFLFGGEVDPSNRGHEGAGNFEGDLVLFDSDGKASDAIRRQGDEPWPSPRGWADATVGDDKFYLFGGLAGDDATPVRLDDLWECQVITK